MFFMYYMSGKHLQFCNQVEDAYSENFLNKIYDRLSIEDQEKKIAFREYVIRNAVNFLDACEINMDRTPVPKQKKILGKYLISLKKVKSAFGNVENCDSVNAAFHATLRKKIKESPSQVEEIFNPYMNVKGGEHDFWSRSEDTFHQFIDTLIDAATDAPNNIHDTYKTDLTTNFILDWVGLTRNMWPRCTNVTFGLGDWIKSNEVDKGSYKSVCVDVLYDLFNVVDKQIMRSQIETAIRKIQ